MHRRCYYVSVTPLRLRIKIMKQTVFEQMNGTYTQQGDYLIPCLTLHDEEKVEIGLWGQRHLRYLK